MQEKRATVPVFSAKNLANNDSAIGEFWVKAIPNDEKRTERAVVPVSGAK